MEKVSIIIPAYNEEKRIGNTLEKYGEFFKLLKKQKKLDFEIIIVINNTKDKTEEVVKTYQKKYKEIRYLNLKPGGKGFAIIEGFKDALTRKNDLIGFVDADNATGPEAYYDLIKNIKNYDGIIASRYAKGSIVTPKQTLLRIIESRIFNLLVRSVLMIPYRDTQCGAKLFKRKAIELSVSKLKLSKWAFDIDLLYAMNKDNFRIKEHATNWSDKTGSHVNVVKTGPMMALAVIRLRILDSIFKGFITFYDKIVSKLLLGFLK